MPLPEIALELKARASLTKTKVKKYIFYLMPQVLLEVLM